MGVFIDLVVQKRLISYKRFDDGIGACVIDLYSFELWTAQYIVRYLFGFRYEELSEMMIDDTLWIVTGWKLKDFLIEELQSWTAPILCTASEQMLGIDKDYVLPYLNDNNCAKQMFDGTLSSVDWFYEDPRTK